MLLKHAQGQRFAEALLDEHLREIPLASNDRALCHEIVYGSIRWRRTLDHLIDRRSDTRKQPDAVRILLRIGLYQLFWLDRIPVHAAVNETVGLANKFGISRQRGFINAVLRRYSRESEKTKTLLTDLRAENPALGCSHPDWLVESWNRQFGNENTNALLKWNNQPARNFARVNTLNTTSEDLRARWNEERIEFQPISLPQLPKDMFFELSSGPIPTGLQSFHEGDFYIQDPSTALACTMLDPQPNDEILDYCAAPGGKTTLLAQLANDQAKIVAHDLHPNRLERVRENCERLGVKSVTEFASPESGLNGRIFDKILVDAPCSNTGVMRRRVDLRWRLSADEITRLAQEQLKLVLEAATFLKPDGKLIYSTCSVDSAENEELVSGLEKEGFNVGNQASLKPFHDRVDGAFAASLTR